MRHLFGICRAMVEMLPYPEEGKGLGFFLLLSWRSQASFSEGVAGALFTLQSVEFVCKQHSF